MSERPSFNPELKVETERTIEGERLEDHVKVLDQQIAGLKEVLDDPDLPEDVREEFEEQLDALKFGLEEIKKGAPLRNID